MYPLSAKSFPNSSSVKRLSFSGALSSTLPGVSCHWAILGCFIGLLIAAAMAFARVHFRWIIAAGFGLLLVADIYLYFQYQTEGSFKNMALVTVINYAGLFIETDWSEWEQNEQAKAETAVHKSLMQTAWRMKNKGYEVKEIM